MQISVSLSSELIKAVDSERGHVPQLIYSEVVYAYLHPKPAPANVERLERDLKHAETSSSA
jgi:hypothetical protein